MLLINSGHGPALFTTSGSSRKEPRQTSPKLPESAIPTTSRGVAPIPLTLTVSGLNKSLLKIVIVAAANPGAVGANRMGTSIDSPGATASGYNATFGSTNSPFDEVMLQISSSAKPELLIVSTRSALLPTHTSPNWPLSSTS